MKAALPRLMREQGLAYSCDARAAVYERNLDGNRATDEALVTILSPALCGPTLSCPTLVVVRRAGHIDTIGSGTVLTPLDSTHRGWRDLGEREASLLPFNYQVRRVVRFDGLRYR